MLGVLRMDDVLQVYYEFTNASVQQSMFEWLVDDLSTANLPENRAAQPWSAEMCACTVILTLSAGSSALATDRCTGADCPVNDHNSSRCAAPTSAAAQPT